MSYFTSYQHTMLVSGLKLSTMSVSKCTYQHTMLITISYLLTYTVNNFLHLVTALAFGGNGGITPLYFSVLKTLQLPDTQVPALHLTRYIVFGYLLLVTRNVLSVTSNVLCVTCNRYVGLLVTITPWCNAYTYDVTSNTIRVTCNSEFEHLDIN